jgi:hypothetical protein
MYGRVYYIFIDGDWLGVSVAMHAKMVAGKWQQRFLVWFWGLYANGIVGLVSKSICYVMCASGFWP